MANQNILDYINRDIVNHDFGFHWFLEEEWSCFKSKVFNINYHCVSISVIKGCSGKGVYFIRLFTWVHTLFLSKANTSPMPHTDPTSSQHHPNVILSDLLFYVIHGLRDKQHCRSYKCSTHWHTITCIRLSLVPSWKQHIYYNSVSQDSVSSCEQNALLLHPWTCVFFYIFEKEVIRLSVIITEVLVSLVVLVMSSFIVLCLLLLVICRCCCYYSYCCI